MKVVGPFHKSDVGGVVPDIKNVETVQAEFDRMIKIKDTTAILIQPMLNGRTLSIVNVKISLDIWFMWYGRYFIEVLKDVQSDITPVTEKMLSE